MSKYIKLIERLNKQNVYLINKLRQMVIRSVPGLKLNFFIKKRRGNEYPIHFTWDLIIETLHKGREITLRKYDNY